MRLSREHNLLFLSNPKSGSDAVRLWLDEVIPDAERERQEEGYALHGGTKHFQRILEDYESLWVFTTIRNPWAKVVSHYFYDRPDKNLIARWQKELGYRGKCEMSFTDFLFKHERLKRLSIDKFAPNAQLFKIEEPEAIRVAIAELLKVEPESLPEIEQTNTTKHLHYSKYFNDRTRDLVARWYAKDIELGSYRFENKRGCGCGKRKLTSR